MIVQVHLNISDKPVTRNVYDLLTCQVIDYEVHPYDGTLAQNCVHIRSIPNYDSPNYRDSLVLRHYLSIDWLNKRACR